MLIEDLRLVPNPPQGIRVVQTGISKKLRHHLWDDAVFVDLLERVEMEIVEVMEGVLRRARKAAWRRTGMGRNGIDDVDRDLAEVEGMENDVDGIAGEGDEGRPMLRAGVCSV